MSTITEIGIEFCGVDHAQYFPGRGTVCSRWDKVYLGMGSTDREALGDAVDQLYQDEDDQHISGQVSLALDQHEASASKVPDPAVADQGDDGELYHYVAVYVRLTDGVT
jgi:hypothetical protein